MAENVPCETCPWRKSNPPGGKGIPTFRIELMRRLLNTVGKGDAFRPVMACHYSPVGGERPCVGYLAVEGWSNLTVRLMAARDDIDPKAIEEACAGIDLWPSFVTMLRAYERALRRRQS